MLKRLFDIIFSFLGLVLLSLLLLIIGLIIKLGSKGPILYQGVRVGKYGKTFKPYKFRTMVENAEELGSLTTADNDSRITKIGKFLRKYKIDEFPQLVNILKGEMSFVGPRPEIKEHVSHYNEQEKIILNVLPGLTDYASIKFIGLDKTVGEKNAHEIFIKDIRSEKNRLRIKYVEKHSFWIDIGILLQTLFVILKKIKK